MDNAERFTLSALKVARASNSSVRIATGDRPAGEVTLTTSCDARAPRDFAPRDFAPRAFARLARRAVLTVVRYSTARRILVVGANNVTHQTMANDVGFGEVVKADAFNTVQNALNLH